MRAWWDNTCLTGAIAREVVLGFYYFFRDCRKAKRAPRPAAPAYGKSRLTHVRPAFVFWLLIVGLLFFA